MAQFDEDEEIVEEAQQQWEEKSMKLIPSFSIPLFLLLRHAEAKTRACAARAIAAGLEQFPAAVKGVLEAVVRKYKEIAAIEDEKERAAFLSTVVALFYLPVYQCTELGYFDTAKHTSGVGEGAAPKDPGSFDSGWGGF